MADCIRWSGAHRKSDGRPIANNTYAYRLVYETFIGPIPKGHVLHHTCGTHWCMNVWEHVEVITQAEHLREHEMPGDHHQSKKTHCPSDHPYSPENTYINARGERVCRVCRREAGRRARAKRGKMGW